MWLQINQQTGQVVIFELFYLVLKENLSADSLLADTLYHSAVNYSFPCGLQINVLHSKDKTMKYTSK